MDPITAYICDGVLLEDKFEACRLRFILAWYYLEKDKLYKRSISSPSLTCLEMKTKQSMHSRKFMREYVVITLVVGHLHIRYFDKHITGVLSKQIHLTSFTSVINANAYQLFLASL